MFGGPVVPVGQQQLQVEHNLVTCGQSERGYPDQGVEQLAINLPLSHRHPYQINTQSFPRFDRLKNRLGFRQEGILA